MTHQATVTARCPACGDHPLEPAQIHLVRAPRPERCFWAFTCPSCRTHRRRPADRATVIVLAAAGVRVHDLDVPAEVLEHDPAGWAPLSAGEVAAWVALLDHDAVLARHLAALATPR